jgi:hypothetical protein
MALCPFSRGGTHTIGLDGRSVLQLRSNPGLSLNAPATFGKIRTARDMQRIQLGARLSF